MKGYQIANEVRTHINIKTGIKQLELPKNWHTGFIQGSAPICRDCKLFSCNRGSSKGVKCFYKYGSFYHDGDTCKYKVQGVDIWENGYEAAIDYIHKETNKQYAIVVLLLIIGIILYFV